MDGSELKLSLKGWTGGWPAKVWGKLDHRYTVVPGGQPSRNMAAIGKVSGAHLGGLEEQFLTLTCRKQISFCIEG